MRIASNALRTKPCSLAARSDHAMKTISYYQVTGRDAGDARLYFETCGASMLDFHLRAAHRRAGSNGNVSYRAIFTDGTSGQWH